MLPDCAPTLMSEPNDGSLSALQAHFLAILPRIELHAAIYFRWVRCPQTREDFIQETRALAWVYFVRAINRGKDPLTFVSQIAIFAAKHARSGRCSFARQQSKDALSPLAQRQRGFRVQTLPSSTQRGLDGIYADPHGQDQMDAVEERLRDNSQTTVPEQVAFRIDWPAWLTTRTERDRRIIQRMALNHRTQDLARKFGMTAGRVSQLRREFHDDWTRFTSDGSVSDH